MAKEKPQFATNALKKTEAMGKGEALKETATDPVRDNRFDTPQKAVYYRFNLKMPLEYEEYLKKAAISASVAAGRQITVTEYINMLIREDMRTHGE